MISISIQQLVALTSPTIKPNSCVSGPSDKFSVLDPRCDSGWDARLKNHPQSHFFMSSGWISALSEAYAYTPCFLADVSKGTLNALLPLMEVRSLFTGSRGVSLPFTDFCPVIFENREDYESSFADALELGRSRNWRYVEIRSGLAPSAGAMPALTYWEHRLRLLPEPEAFRALKPETRTALRKAGRCGVTIARATNREAIVEYYRLHCLTRRKHGVPPQPFRFFDRVWHHVIAAGDGDVFLARHQGKVVASAVFLRWGRQVIYKYGASDPKRQELRANNLLFWEAINYYREQEFDDLHLGRTGSTEMGLRRFKRGLGAVESSIGYYKYDLRSGGYLSSVDASNSRTANIFRRLPEGVNRLIGNCVYRHFG